jgi:apolipoprotein D and lipocalin family protein
MKRWLTIALVPAFLLLAGCQSMSPAPIDTVERLDLPRFMGDWYVIGNIPTFIERTAHNAVESYTLSGDGTVVNTRFRFRDGGFDGPVKEYHPTGYVSEHSNAVWGMQFIWPVKAEFLVLHVDETYHYTIIGRSKRDYVWLMARDPVIPDAAYEELLAIAADAGYDISRIRRVPQSWPEA